MKNFFDFRRRPGRLPVRNLKKEIDIRVLESRIYHHARGEKENPKKVHQLYQSTAKNQSLWGKTAKSASDLVKHSTKTRERVPTRMGSL